MHVVVDYLGEFLQLGLGGLNIQIMELSAHE